jgi:hypothetical protein
MKFFLCNLLLLLCWGYIVTFTKVLTLYQIIMSFSKKNVMNILIYELQSVTSLETQLNYSLSEPKKHQ